MLQVAIDGGRLELVKLLIESGCFRDGQLTAAGFTLKELRDADFTLKKKKKTFRMKTELWQPFISRTLRRMRSSFGRKESAVSFACCCLEWMAPRSTPGPDVPKEVALSLLLLLLLLLLLSCCCYSWCRSL